MNKYKQREEYFGRFPLLEGLILARFKTVVNFCEEIHCAFSAVTHYLKGDSNPSFEFIQKCLEEFSEYTFEELFCEKLPF